VNYLLFLGLVNYQVSSQPDKAKLAGALFLASKIMHSKSSRIEDLCRVFNLRHEDIKAVALELFTFLSSEESEERLTAVRRMFNHSQYGYISTIKLSFKLQ
jgi:Cyclin, C-terminal domain